MLSPIDDILDLKESQDVRIETIECLKNLTLEDGEIGRMSPSGTDEAGALASIPMEYDFDMEDEELKNIKFPETNEASSGTSDWNSRTSQHKSYEKVDLDAILNFLQEAAKKKTNIKPPTSPRMLKARRRINFDDTSNGQLKVSVRLKKLKEVREKTMITKSILGQRKQNLLKKLNVVSSELDSEETTTEWHTPPCPLGGDECFICNSYTSEIN